MIARLAIVLLLVTACSAAASARDAPPAAKSSLHGRIAYNSAAGDVWVMNANGTGRRQITKSGRGVDYDPDFSPDGRRIVFRTSRGRYARDVNGIGLEGIFVVDLKTKTERQIQPRTGGLFPAWSPDGKWIAFSGLGSDATRDTIHLMRPDGTGVVDLGPMGECATWSPDSSRLMYCSHNGDGNWAVWVMNDDGSEQRQLTHPVLKQPAGSRGDYPGAWSPDGTRIAYSTDVDGDREVFVMNADGTDQRRLTRMRGADSPQAWLPDGRVVVAHYRGSSPTSYWYLVRPDGTGLRSLPHLKGLGAPIAWRP
jgi:Tol biopolymer transport system component